MPARSPSIRIIWQLTTFSVFAFFAYVVALLFSAPLVLLSRTAAETAMYFFAAAALLGVSGLVLMWFHVAPLRAIGIGLDRPWLSHSALGIAFGGLLITLVWAVFQLGGWLKAGIRPDQAGFFGYMAADFMLFLGVAAHEEILCRGYAFQILYRRSKALAFLLPGLVFVALHWTNTGAAQPIAICNLFLAHVFFAVCYLRMRSLWFPIGVHAGWNFVLADVLGLPVSGNPAASSLLSGEPVQNVLTGFSFGPEGGLLVTAILLVGTFAIWRFVRQRQPAVDLLSWNDASLPSDALAGKPPVAPDPGDALVAGHPVPGPVAPGPDKALAGDPPVAPGPDRALAERLAAAPALTDARPRQASERVLAIDVLRGVAVLSILPMNMEIFALVPQAVIHPYAGVFTDSTNVIAWVALRVLVGTIGLSLFSLLFGAGLLLFEGAKGGGAESPTALHYRRLAVLAVIGFAHAYLIWSGDILVTYAMVGAFVWVFRRCRPGRLITLGALSFAVPMLLLVVAQLLMPQLSPESQANFQLAILPSAEHIQEMNEAYRSGWLGQMEQRFSDALANQTLAVLICMGWIAGGMMLMGMGMHKLGLLTARASNRTYWKMIAFAVLIGFPLLAYAFIWSFQRDWRLPDGFFLGWAMRETSYPIIMMGWIGAVMLICKAGSLKGLTARLAATGQMALTNYLTHSVLCHLIFYGTGLGLINKVSIPMQIIITVVIWIGQLIYSPMWLARYRFGPAEWLWRSLSYGRWFELRSAPRPLAPQPASAVAAPLQRR